MNHLHGLAVPSRAATFERPHGDRTPTPKAVIPKARCHRQCPGCPLRRTSKPIGGDRRLSSNAHGQGASENPRKNQDRKVHRTGPVSTLLSPFLGGRLALMNARTREQPADPSSAATCPTTDPLPLHKYPFRRRAWLSAVFAPSRQRPGCRRRFDAGALAHVTVAESGGRSPSGVNAATSKKRAGGNG